MSRPTFKPAPGDASAGVDERIIEVWSPMHRAGCLVSIRQGRDPYTNEPRVWVEAYSADPAVRVRVCGADQEAPT